jgi:hypothetical protein
MNDFDLELQLFWKCDQRNHDLGPDFSAFPLHLGSGFKDGTGLHLGDFGEGDAETTAAVTEHRVELVQLVYPAGDQLDRHLHFFCKIDLLLAVVRQKLVEWRIEKPDRGRQAIERLENSDEIFALIREQLRHRFDP